MLEYAAVGSYSPTGSIYKLIEKAVYKPLHEEIKEFLAMLCIFDSFTLKQAVFMWGNENAAWFLDELTVGNSFVKYDGRLKTYHIHTIFTEFLKEVLEGKEVSHQQILYRKAAQWFMTNGDYSSARRYYYKCGDFDGILLALEEDRFNDCTTSEMELLKKYMAECPKEVKARHHHASLSTQCTCLFIKSLNCFMKYAANSVSI